MTEATKEITVEDLKQTRTRQVADVTEAKQSQESALQAFGKNQKSANVTDLLALAKAVETSKSAVEAAERKVKATDAQITLAEWDTGGGKQLGEANTLTLSATKEAVEASAESYTGVGAERIDIAVTGLNTESPTYAIKATGGKIPGKVKRAASSGNGRGRVKFQTPNGPLGSLELLEQYGPTSDIAERCAAMVADPDRGRKGMSHLARTLAEKLNFPIS